MDDATEVFNAGGVGPLNVPNTDTRLIASAIRVAIEPTLGKWITQDQWRFIGGRPMMANILDVEQAMIEFTLLTDKAAALPPLNMLCVRSFSKHWVGRGC